MSTVQAKIWGTNTEIYHTEVVSVNVLHIVKGGTCSLHTHKSKHNLFYVISGELKLQVKYLGELIFPPGGEWLVQAGQEHRFQAMVPTVVVETVFVKLDANDIDRKEIGYREDCLNSDLWRNKNFISRKKSNLNIQGL